MESQRNNLVEVKRIKPVENKTNYKAIAPQNLTSVSNFSQHSIIIPELNSTSQPLSLREESKREA